MYKQKVASVEEVIERLQYYEHEHGSGGVITGIGIYANGDRTKEYVFHLQDKNGIKTDLEIDSVCV